MTPVVKQLTGANWDREVLGARGPVLVDFWAPWCPSCRTLGPTIEKLAAEFEGRAIVGQLDVDDDPKVAERYGIRSIPTIIVFQGGLPVHRQIGAVPEPRLALLLETNLALPERAGSSRHASRPSPSTTVGTAAEGREGRRS